MCKCRAVFPSFSLQRGRQAHTDDLLCMAWLLLSHARSEENKQEFFDELNTMKTLWHPNIVTLTGVRELKPVLAAGYFGLVQRCLDLLSPALLFWRT